MSLEGSLPEAPGQVGESVEEGLQEREVLAVPVVTGHLPQGRQEGGHLVPHPLLLTQLCQQVDTSSVRRGRERGTTEQNVKSMNTCKDLEGGAWIRVTDKQEAPTTHKCVSLCRHSTLRDPEI